MGSVGLIVTTFYTFLPCFLFIFAGGPIIEKTHGNHSREQHVRPYQPAGQRCRPVDRLLPGDRSRQERAIQRPHHVLPGIFRHHPGDADDIRQVPAFHQQEDR